MSGYVIGVDVGGTFTDLVCVGEAGDVLTAKVPSTPADQGIGVLSGIANLADRAAVSVEDLLARTKMIVHGTTVATNTMIEWSGAHTYLLTTRGFRDLIDIRRNYKEAAFDIRLKAPYPIVPRRRRIPITERITETGAVLTPLAEEEVRAAARRLADEGAQAVAICFLFSFLAPEHELRAREIIHEVLPSIHVSLSHEVLPKIREFERLSTTIVDAYVTPKLRGYLTNLERTLAERGYAGDFFIMRSNGGVVDVGRAAESGVQLVASGPAGGVVAASSIGAAVSDRNLLTIDMGGTSADVSLIRDGTPSVSMDSWFSRYRVAVPLVDVTSVGAGGGSIAWIDDGGALRIGPASAGSYPGPACYGRGGTAATVTDANLILGYIGADSFLGGAMALDVEGARRALQAGIADPLGVGVEEAAAAIVRIVNHNMANALRVISIEKGYDVRDFSLMAFGGGGPLHAAALVQELRVRRILVPRGHASVLCALGDVLADIRESRSRGYYARSETVDLPALAQAVTTMVDEADALMGEQARNLRRVVECALEMRYKGQTHEVAVPIGSGLEPTPERWAEVLADFDRLHAQRFSYSRPGAEIEIVGLQVDRFALRAKPEMNGLGRTSQATATSERPVHFPTAAGYVPTPIYSGVELGLGFTARGPLVIEEANTSVVVMPGQRVSLVAGNVYIIEDDR
ncbi:hydantoinase/oxoprolinase family protein [Pseudaminobacter arsenicus]|uniref:Hydantoinase/oxoprolinase family protein n=1 Tax=Borborobacter arsenicus TaxID=1851146 RepID=A0A432V7Y6_9HYPH|nr:hydantoinase/oxoprolinase family protein [Pseudaminobacter arsenicus]RUM98284.1 hydantoinase/oxoprolinase family protein [Pseudaminobacter arsenicus]